MDGEIDDLIDALTMQFRTIQVRRDPECPACGTREIRELIDYDAFCGVASNGDGEPSIREIAPRELDKRLRRGDDIQLIDVRENWEWQIARIPGAKLVPLSDFESASSEIDRDREVVLYCKVGARSMHAAEYLADRGFPRVANLSGGILRWADEVDPAVPRY
jgi:adenylyltransferase/sulfurtransferase